MKKLVLSVMLSLGLVGAVNAQTIGVEPFDYPDGAIGGLSGGDFWTWNNIVKDYSNSKSAWEALWGNVVLQNQALLTNDGGALRHYGGNLDDAAFRATGVVYYRVLFTALSDQGWCGISGYDFGSERIFFGMPGGQDGMGNFGIEAPDHGKWLSNIPVEIDREVLLICAIDFDGDQVRMWVNPDADDWDNGAADNSADVRGGYGGTNWNTGVRMASGGSCKWDSLVVANDFWDVVPKVARNPYPDNGLRSVPLEITVGWDPALDPENPNQSNPAITAHRLYTNFADPSDPNLYFIAEFPNTGERVDSGPYTLVSDTTYSWRVDEVVADANDIVGAVWQFETVLSVPTITGQPSYQVVPEGGLAAFTVVVDSMSPPTYQWYRYVDGISDIELADSDTIAGSQTEMLTIDNAQLADEGGYYCIVTNAAAVPVKSRNALLGIQRKIASWSFEDSSAQSDVPGSPDTVIHGQPTFGAGAVGNAMVFRAGLDMLYTDPNTTSYFDICNYNMTVACWVKTTTAQTWAPFVARHGEGNQGWQIRQGSVAGRPTFTTRQTGNDDGTRGDRSVANGAWHYVVGTYDGSIKKLYIDGVLSRFYSQDTGVMLRDGDAVSGMIGQTRLPVAIAGRVTGTLEEMSIEQWNVVGASYDEVEIYNYALDAQTIARNYATVKGQAVCTEHLAFDMNGDCTVDVNDFAMFAQEWLTSALVQPNP